MKTFPIYKQLNAMDCGPTCLRMVAKYHVRFIFLKWLCNKSQYGKEGVSMLGLADAAKIFGLKKVRAKLSFDQLINVAPLPFISYWDQYHFVALTPGSTRNKLVFAPTRIVSFTGFFLLRELKGNNSLYRHRPNVHPVG